MRPIDLKLRCYAQQEPDKSWFAICIDLNLAAQGDSMQEVRQRLHVMIKNYINEALTEDEKYIDDLMPRKVPFIFVLRYYWLSLVSKLRHSMVNHAVTQRFIEHLPLVPTAYGR